MNVVAFPTPLKPGSTVIHYGLSDETLLFNERQIEFLARRGLIYLTERSGGCENWGTVVAASQREAEQIAASRHPGERPIGLRGFGFLGEIRNPPAPFTSQRSADPSASREGPNG